MRTHMPQCPYSRTENDLDSQEWLSILFFHSKPPLSMRIFCKVGSTLAMAEMLAGGTSTFANMYFYQAHVANDVKRVGMRAYLVQRNY